MPKSIRTEGGVAIAPELFPVLGVSRQRSEQLMARADFPDAAIETISGRKIWRVREVERWNQKRLATES